ncbi:maleylpyruvate isomerase family mycothiol-dependent enzyme [Nocardioides xinjiangensis]|uniref:maleylpyruvate isomerase family mycothiol-dependent enzyme n=1 Tax=Nocardioides xinjiangensis TaxID=2817376 RepID=UPI001B30847D|nr:maleylpyruvate isomerase family mycothiol-dependent enzyme [Nocardioides sp. SYSU D00778]
MAPSTHDLLTAERLALVDDLSALTTAQWQEPSLCAGWRVVDVAAHLAWTPTLGALQGAVALARYRSVNRMIARTAVAWSARGREAILEQLTDNARSGETPIGMPRVSALADAVVHGIDVRRPLGLPHDLPPPAVGRIADFALATPWPLTAVIGGSSRRRVAGVRLVVPEAGWSHGDGPEVTLSANAAVRLVYGRPVSGEELDGPGVPVLLPRL